MWCPTRSRSTRTPEAEGRVSPRARRERLAGLLALLTVAAVSAALLFSEAPQFQRLLMPGPLASAHGAIENCGSCHTRSGSGKLSWMHGLIAGDPRADSKACLACHRMPETAFNPHGAADDILRQSTERLSKLAVASPAPPSIHAQSRAFPTRDLVAGGLPCATCHQEHQGTGFDLARISNAQCQSCHVVQFDSFDGRHPRLDGYPFRRRTRLVYDHAAHFDKHFPEVAKKDPARRIPATCAGCHDSRQDERVMAVAPFEQTCAACHRDQITGKERVSGPKGIAFLSLPGLDLRALRTRASIGDWPEGSEAQLTPFMKLMIGATERGRDLIRATDGIDLQDLSQASDAQIRAVSDLAWEIKRLVYRMIKEKASDVLVDLAIDGRQPRRADLVSDLTASIPRDVLVAAQRQWLPDLAAEMSRGPGPGTRQDAGWSTVTSQPDSHAQAASTDPAIAAEASPAAEPAEGAGQPRPAATGEAAAEPDGQGCLVRVLGQCLVLKAPRQDTGAARPGSAAGRTDTATSTSTGGEGASTRQGLPAAMRAGLQDVRRSAQAGAPPPGNDAASRKPHAGTQLPAASKEPRGQEAPRGQAQGSQSDDLLSPTEAEREAIRAHGKLSGRSPRSDQAPAGAVAGPGAETVTAPAAASIGAGIDSDVDPESWAEAGGWYQHDHTIYYRPVGHKDKFLHAWLMLTGPRARTGEGSPAARVFESLTRKDAQGSCAKCHSVDTAPGGGRTINFAPLSSTSKQGRFTRFMHEPHFAVVGDQGCLTCHKLEGNPAYLKSYEQGDPLVFRSEFGAIQKDRCQGCHSTGRARQDCLLCHTYHMPDVITPITATKLPTR